MEQVLTNRVVDKLATKQQDMRQRSIVNLAPSQNLTDAVNRSELDQVNNTLQQSIDNTNNTLTTLQGQGAKVYDLTLTTATITINPPTSGTDWTVILRQDATGGRAFTWGAGITYASNIIDASANTVSTFRFIKTTKGWVMVGQPTTGMTL